MRKLIALIVLACPLAAYAGAQQYEPLAAAVQTALHTAVSESDQFQI